MTCINSGQTQYIKTKLENTNKCINKKETRNNEWTEYMTK